MNDISIKMREFERTTQRKVNKALSSIEVAVAQWEMSPEKNKKMEKRIERLRNFHYYFSQWERMSIIECSVHSDVESTSLRLEQFAGLCEQFRDIQGR